jgi:hypothetical protein
MSVSILTVDDEADVAELFRQHFRRELRQAFTFSRARPKRRWISSTEASNRR